MTFIIYTTMYFILGFVLARFYKVYDTLNSKDKHTDYALLGIFWLPMLIINLIILLYSLYKEKI